jgi:hypothetical protein
MSAKPWRHTRAQGTSRRTARREEKLIECLGEIPAPEIRFLEAIVEAVDTPLA